MAVDEGGAEGGEAAFWGVGEGLIEPCADDELEDGVAEVFEALVVGGVGGGG